MTDDPHPPEEMAEAIEQLEARLAESEPQHIGAIACVAVFTDEAHEEEGGIAFRAINPDTASWEDTASLLNAAHEFDNHLERARLTEPEALLGGGGDLGDVLGQLLGGE